jgi:hypothetical protein
MDPEKRKSYVDYMHRLADQSRWRAELVANTAQNVSAIRKSMEEAARARAAQSEAPHPPWVGEVLIYLLVPLDRQDDRLGDFAERFQMTWLPRCGPRLAGVIYVAQVLWSAAAVAKIRMVAAIVDFFVSLLDR